MFFGQAGGYSVIKDDAVLSAHDPISDRSDWKFEPLVDVEVVEQKRNIWAAKIDLANWAYVDDPHGFPNASDFSFRIAVVFRSQPLACVEPLSAVRSVPLVEGRDASWFLGASL